MAASRSPALRLTILLFLLFLVLADLMPLGYMIALSSRGGAEPGGEGAWVWWSLAVVASLIRWLIDAHWLSDVLMGGAFGIACGLLAVAGIDWIG